MENAELISLVVLGGFFYAAGTAFFFSGLYLNKVSSLMRQQAQEYRRVAKEHDARASARYADASKIHLAALEFYTKACELHAHEPQATLKPKNRYDEN